MPIYEYNCPNCGNNFEEWLKVSECEEPQPCPNCKSQSHRIVSQTSFVLKGEGWYVTEYGKNSASSKKSDAHSSPQIGAEADAQNVQNQAKNDENTQSKSETKSEAKAESKSENTQSNTSAKSESASVSTSKSTSNSQTNTAPSA